MRTRRAGAGAGTAQNHTAAFKAGKVQRGGLVPPLFSDYLYSEQNLYGVHTHLTLAQMHAGLDTLIGHYRQSMRGLSDAQFFQQQGFHR